MRAKLYTAGMLMLLLCGMGTAGIAQNNREPSSDTIQLADPTIFKDAGIYYLYGTSEAEGFKVYTSADLVQWTYKGLALQKGESYGTKGFWAPQVFKYRGKYVMAYTADEYIAIAFATSPLGPFTQKKLSQLIADVKMIDPFVFIDDNKVYLYHVRLDKGNRIFVAEMDEELSSLKRETLKECLYAEAGWENISQAEWPVAEGPSVFKQGHKYYMLYSANDFRNPAYAVGLAVAGSPVGPWEKATFNPVLSAKSLQVKGPGHGEIFRGLHNSFQYVFHTHHSNEKVSPRKTAMLQVSFDATKDSITMLPATFYYLKTTQ